MPDLLEPILNVLYWDVAVPRDRLTVKVRDGVVTLSGEVDEPYQKSCAEADVRRVGGVAGVKNEIAVRAEMESKH